MNPQEKKQMLNKYSGGAYILVLLVLLMMTDFPVWSTLWSNPK